MASDPFGPAVQRPENFEYPTEAYRAGDWEPPPRRNPRRLRIVAVIVVLALVLLGGGATVVAFFMRSAGMQPLPADIGAPRTAGAVQLVTGNCLETLPDDGEVLTVRVVPCAQPHSAQVITQYAFSPDAVWPGQEQVDARVARACQLTAAQVEAGVRAVAWAPTAASWGRGDRSGLCLAVLPEPATGSLIDVTPDLPSA